MVFPILLDLQHISKLGIIQYLETMLSCCTESIETILYALGNNKNNNNKTHMSCFKVFTSVVVLASFMSFEHNLGKFERKKSQQRKCFHNIGLQSK